MNIYFAPLQGYTEDAYRRLHKEIFGGVDTYYTPFIRIEHGNVRSKDMRDIRPEFNKGVHVIPQIIVSNTKETDTLASMISQLGYDSIDINMGCPFPLQTRHGRGAGMLPNPERIKEVLNVIKHHPEIHFSVKMRLGLNEPNEWKDSINLLNDAPLTHITIHPRTAAEQYKGGIHLDSFNEFLQSCNHPIIFNGEIRTIEDIKKIEEYYSQKIKGVMIGRGLLARPSLASEYKNNMIMEEHELLIRIIDMHSRLDLHYQKVILSEPQRLAKLRTFWDYLEPTIGRKKWKNITKAGNAKNYYAAIGEII